MNLPRAAAGVALVLLLTSCTTTTPDAAAPSTSTPSAPAVEKTPTPTPESTLSDLTNLADLAGTTWQGTDSQSAVEIISFKEGGSLRFDSYGDILAFSDAWSVDGDTVSWFVAFGPPYGTNDAVGTLDVDTQTISAEYTSRDGLEPFTIELTQIPYTG